VLWIVGNPPRLWSHHNRRHVDMEFGLGADPSGMGRLHVFRAEETQASEETEVESSRFGPVPLQYFVGRRITTKSAIQSLVSTFDRVGEARHHVVAGIEAGCDGDRFAGVVLVDRGRDPFRMNFIWKSVVAPGGRIPIVRPRQSPSATGYAIRHGKGSRSRIPVWCPETKPRARPWICQPRKCASWFGGS
jgi:hypothetical protein